MVATRINQPFEMHLKRMPFLNSEKCKKCNGQMYMDSDQFGTFEVCLQCGLTKEVEMILPKTYHDKEIH